VEDWPFDQAPNVAAVTCQSVLDGAPILLVVHYSDDDSWAFLDGGEFDPDEARVAGMGMIVRMHPAVTEIATLPPGWVARRDSAATPWVRAADPEV
jgi:hypothetical protein